MKYATLETNQSPMTDTVMVEAANNAYNSRTLPGRMRIRSRSLTAINDDLQRGRRGVCYLPSRGGSRGHGGALRCVARYCAAASAGELVKGGLGLANGAWRGLPQSRGGRRNLGVCCVR